MGDWGSGIGPKGLATRQTQVRRVDADAPVSFRIGVVGVFFAAALIQVVRMALVPRWDGCPAAITDESKCLSHFAIGLIAGSGYSLARSEGPDAAGSQVGFGLESLAAFAIVLLSARQSYLACYGIRMYGIFSRDGNRSERIRQRVNPSLAATS